MKAAQLLAVITLVMVSTVLPANELDANNEQVSTHEVTGTGIGAIIGAIIAGPPGAVVGGMTGNFAGASIEAEETLFDLEQAYSKLKSVAENLRVDKLMLADELTSSKNELQQLRTIAEQPIQLPGGFSLSVQFRHDSSRLEPVFINQIAEIAKSFISFDGMLISLSGHADRRGAEYYNQSLSVQRVKAVANELCKAGWPKNRMQFAAYGESEPLADVEDLASYDFDRRVTLSLTPVSTQ